MVVFLVLLFAPPAAVLVVRVVVPTRCAALRCTAWLPAGHEKDPQKRQMQVTEQRQQGETAVVQLQARLAGDSNQLLAAKLQPEGADGDGAAAAAEAEAAEAEAAPGQQQEAEQQHAAAAAAAVNPFFAAPWSDAQQQRKARIATSGR